MGKTKIECHQHIDEDGEVVPFGNGTEYQIWCESNCEVCDKSWNPDNPEEINCDIENDMSLGSISMEQFEQIGEHYNDKVGSWFLNDCPLRVRQLPEGK